MASKFSDFDALSTLKKLRTLNLAGNYFHVDIFKYLVALPALRSPLLQNQDASTESYDTDLDNSLDDKGAKN